MYFAGHLKKKRNTEVGSKNCDWEFKVFFHISFELGYDIKFVNLSDK